MKVDLWLAKLDELPEEDGKNLSKEELKRADRFLYQKHKILFIKRRSILRKLLSNYLLIESNEIIIKQTKLGKPYVANAGAQIYFNISHSKDYVLYGFSLEAELGVDIEFLNAEIEAELISNHFFSSYEMSLILSSKDKNNTEIFFRLWCIKEAYIKLVGKGLTFPLDQVLVKDTMFKPRLEIPSKSKGQELEDLSCIYVDLVKDFGIGVVVKGNNLEIEYRLYDS